jgi:uncharacterized protein (DUF885 family)
MKRILLVSACILTIVACKPDKKAEPTVANKQFAAMCEQYYQDGLKMNPLAATYIGDDRYDDLLANDGSVEFIKEYKSFNERYLDSLKAYERETLDANDKLSFDYLKDQLDMNIEGLKYHSEYLPFNQMFALPLTIGQLGSGTGAQPFKTVKNYENWLKRAAAFSIWADTAISNFKKGEAAGIVLPKALVIKMIPQMQSMIVKDARISLFYGPITLMPKTFSAVEKQKLTEDYLTAITTVIIPTYKRLGDFLQNEYLPKARTTSGYSSMPGGAEWYAYLVRQQTTTKKSPEEVYQTGLKEVSRIKSEMDSIKTLVGFKSDLKAFFEYMKTDKKFMPYTNAKEILAAFENIHQRMKPNLKKMFEKEPKTPFEIRQTEAFRAASASAEYNQGSADGKRPGIFYVPILDAKTFNTTSGMESLFLHEAIPGHHYQISLTQENTQLPNFRRFGGHNAYVEGWALYCESLGKELGLYQDPYQHMGALGDEMHRAIRLVVDVAIHTKNMTRDQAIKYMTDNEAMSIEGATAEIERYMGIPGQALGYKTGAMKIRELRAKYMTQLGAKFKLAAFHTEVLKDGSLPLSVFESKMDAWATNQK